MHGEPWRPEDIALLRRLWAAGETAHAIRQSSAACRGRRCSARFFGCGSAPRESRRLRARTPRGQGAAPETPGRSPHRVSPAGQDAASADQHLLPLALYTPSSIAIDHPVARALLVSTSFDFGSVTATAATADDFGTPTSLSIEFNVNLGTA